MSNTVIDMTCPSGKLGSDMQGNKKISTYRCFVYCELIIIDSFKFRNGFVEKCEIAKIYFANRTFRHSIL